MPARQRRLCGKGGHVLQKTLLTTSWGLGLSENQAVVLRATLGEEHGLICLDEEELRRMQPAPHSAPPLLFWVSSRCRGALSSLPEAVARHIAATPQVLLLDEGYTLADFEAACDQGMAEILRPPLRKKRIADIMCRALEVHALQHDMECMAREITLGRELLERKSELLGFLTHFLGQAGDSPDCCALFRSAYQGLGKLLPLRAMHAVLWDTKDGEAPALSLFTCSPPSTKAEAAWHETLLELARRALGSEAPVIETLPLDFGNLPEHQAASLPHDGALLSLPIQCGKEHMGVLLLLTCMERHLGRDQVLALDAAMRHFSLCIKNTLHFRQPHQQTGYDQVRIGVPHFGHTPMPTWKPRL